jgi:uncharacterized protein YyaL (SSP411 family)
MPNQLIHSKSPYLLQHANNPVDWMPWDDQTLKKAREENRLLIISIGYSACHWCHVMEHESFEDEEVAALMNAYYISIKVDREERPDVDQVYMSAAMLINGNGGWPLNAIALPDGRPVYAGTYFPKQNWLRVLAYFADQYQKDPAKLTEQAQRLTDGIRSLDQTPPLQAKASIDPKLLDIIWQNWKPNIDTEFGGRKGAPKFMMPNQYLYLLKYAYSSKNEEVKAFIHTTLHKMALGGLNDQLAGGFTRYSTDPYWKVPHFEKMLYDNAQLLSFYAQAYRAYGNELYLDVVHQIISWLENEMKAPEGGYYAELDADSEGEEGKFYVWTFPELMAILGKDAEVFCEYYTCTPGGNWEHGLNVLHATETQALFARKKGLNEDAFNKMIDACRNKLLEVRSKRIRPGLDDKRITGWNALLLSGLVEAYWATGDQNILLKAKDLAAFFTTTLQMPDGGLWHTFNKGESYLEGYLSDYSPAIMGFIQLYQASAEEGYLMKAYQWLDYVIEHFYDENSGFFFLTSNQSDTLISRPKELNDNVISASNSILSRVLWQMGYYFDKPFLKEMANYMLQHVLQDTLRNGTFYAEWASLLWEMAYPFYEVAFTDEHSDIQTARLFSSYLPQVLPVSSKNVPSKIPLLTDKTAPLIYVCRNQACLAPVKTLDEVTKILAEQGL